MAHLEKDKHLGRYLHIIRDSPVYPVIYDANKVVCSLPPIINGEHSKITLNTRNVFIEITATDRTKLDIVCNIMVAMFSGYCADAFAIEPVRIVSEHNGASRVTPSMVSRNMAVEVDYINGCFGLSESAASQCKLLEKMGYTARPSPKDKNVIDVTVPPTRADVLQACDVVGQSAYLPTTTHPFLEIQSPFSFVSNIQPSFAADGRCCHRLRLQQSAARVTEQGCHDREAAAHRQALRYRAFGVRHVGMDRGHAAE